MKTINYYEIVLREYNGTLYGRLRYEDNGEIHESSWSPLPIVSGTIQAWKANDLLGSFGIGTILAEDARFILCEQ